MHHRYFGEVIEKHWSSNKSLSWSIKIFIWTFLPESLVHSTNLFHQCEWKISTRWNPRGWLVEFAVSALIIEKGELRKRQPQSEPNRCWYLDGPVIPHPPSADVNSAAKKFSKKSIAEFRFFNLDQNMFKYFQYSEYRKPKISLIRSCAWSVRMPNDKWSMTIKHASIHVAGLLELWVDALLRGRETAQTPPFPNFVSVPDRIDADISGVHSSRSHRPIYIISASLEIPFKNINTVTYKANIFYFGKTI